MKKLELKKLKGKLTKKEIKKIEKKMLLQLKGLATVVKLDEVSA